MRDSDFVTTALGETTHLASLLGECTRDPVGEVTMRVRAATSSRLPSVAGDGWFAVGDAAMTFASDLLAGDLHRDAPRP